MEERREDMRTSIAASLADTTDYISATIPSINMVMDGYYQQFSKDTSSYFENVLHNLQKIHQDSFDRREQELYRQIAELQGQNLDLQEQLTSMTEKCAIQQALLDRQLENSVARQNKKHRVHVSPWALKKVFLAWKTQTKRSKQCSKTDKFLERWERKHFSFKTFALWSHEHSALKYDHTMTESKFKYETLSNEMVMHYENEQSKLQNDLNDAYALVKKEEEKRIQLEDSMRKMFMKNLNSMNMEALSIFQSINKFDASDILGAHHVYQQQQQAALNAAVASTGSFSGDNSNPQTTNNQQSNDIGPPSTEAVSTQNSGMFSAQIQVPAQQQPSTQSYGMFSPGPPPPPPLASVSLDPYRYQQQQYQQQQPVYPPPQQQYQQQPAASTPNVRFDLSANGSHPSPIVNYSTPHKQSGTPYQPIDMSGVQDKEYMGRLAEQYRQSTSASARFVQNTYPPQPNIMTNTTTPIRSPTSHNAYSAQSASNASAHPTPTGASSMTPSSILSGYNIRRK